MEVKLRVSNDGSNTLYVPSLNEHYHSTNGAITEAQHVYIKDGLRFYSTSEACLPYSTINVLEIGFGTGLNALVTAFEELPNQINYDGLELNPLPIESILSLNYPSQLGGKSEELFVKIAQAKWNESQLITENFTLRKLHQNIMDWQPNCHYQVVYFDAFAPEVQPEMWDLEILKKVADATVQHGVLTTYCAKGEVRRRLQATGFKVFRIPGPPGKREMIRAVKL